MSYYREIYCCECKQVVQARFTEWKEVYPHLRELPYKHFYICDKCKNFVGVHKGTNIPLGTIPTPEIKEYRKKIHSIIDPIFLKSKNKNLVKCICLGKSMSISRYIYVFMRCDEYNYGHAGLLMHKFTKGNRVDRLKIVLKLLKFVFLKK